MHGQRLDAVVLTSPHALRYYTGFTGSNGLAVVRPSGAWFLTDGRYREQIAGEVRGVRRIVAAGDLAAAAGARKLLEGCPRAGIEERSVTVALLLALRRAAPRTRMVPAADAVEAPMLRKDPSEIASLRRAIRISERVFGEVFGLLRPGAAERDIAAAICARQRQLGADRDAFEPIVASGPRSALPHARATARRLRTGEPVLLDFGCVVDGYHADLARTVVVGRSPRRLRDLHAAVLDAHAAACDAVRPGATGADVDAAARAVLRRAGLDRRFVHALGHGLGLRLHEGPRLGARSADVLEEGAVVTVEPGVYIPGFGGVRVEDDILVTRNGWRSLSVLNRDLLVIA